MKIKLVENRGWANLKWRENDKKYAKLLSSTNAFKEITKKARQEIRKNPSEPDKITEKYAQKVLDLYYLSGTWKWPLMKYFETGEMPAPIIGVHISNALLPSPGSISIIVTEKMGYNKFLAIISDMREELKRYLNLLPRKRGGIRGNFEMRVEALNKFEETKDINDVLDFLSKKYGDKAPDEGVLRQWIRRTESALKGIRVS